MASAHRAPRPIAHSRRLRRARSKRALVLYSALGILVVILAAAAWVGVRALIAKSSLEAAVSEVKTVEGNLSSFDTSKLGKTYSSLHNNTSTAESMTSDWVWGAAEHLPLVGPNLIAFRQTAVVVNDVVEDGLHPIVAAADGVNLDSFKPVKGKINLAPIERLSPAVVKAAGAMSKAERSAKAIDTTSTIDLLKKKVVELQGLLGKASDAAGELAKIVPIIAPALGSDGPRHYLMIFQGNSEIRALGGNPASMALIEANDGSIKITKQFTSTDFENARATSVAPLDPKIEQVFGDIVGRWIPNITSVPDFPTAAYLTRAYYTEVDNTKLDGIISFDPVALSYLLSATGPITLPTGDVLSGKNAVSLLLNEVYFKYPVLKDQDRFFASAASATFQVLTSGKGNPINLFKMITKATNEGRLMMWSDNAKETALIANTRLQGTLPVTNTASTAVGAYFNDVTGSKMDYYLKVKTALASTQCTSDSPIFTETVTLTNTINATQAENLPLYVSGKWYTPGDVATDVVVYGPVGASITSWKADRSAILKTSGAIGGRPVSRILTTLKPGESITLTYTMTGAKGKYGPLEQRTTPMVWPTPTTVSSPGCVVAKK